MANKVQLALLLRGVVGAVDAETCPLSCDDDDGSLWHETTQKALAARPFSREIKPSFSSKSAVV